MIHVCEHHDAVLTHWRDLDLRGRALAHVDFHDDLRGLLIDRRRGQAFPLGDLTTGGAGVDAGNFLAHAVLEGRLDRLRWIHDRPGGRGWDMGIVRYHSDLSVRARRPQRGTGRPLAFDETLMSRWQGLTPGELLSVDWDCFASSLIPADTVDERVRRFLDQLGPHIPLRSWIAYSPEYCHPSLDAFRRFVDELARRFDQPIDWLSPELEHGRLHPSGVDSRLPRSLAARMILFLRRRGIY